MVGSSNGHGLSTASTTLVTRNGGQESYRVEPLDCQSERGATRSGGPGREEIMVLGYRR